MSQRFEKAKYLTEKYKNQLLPCPECKNTNIRICTDRTVFPKPMNVWFVACQTPFCDCTGSYTSVKVAIKKWNDKVRS